MSRLLASLLILLIAATFQAKSEESAAFNTAAELYRSQQFIEAKAAFLGLANQNHARANAILGMMARFGEGGPIDLTQAFEFYLSSARAGYAPAQYQVAVMFEEGEGVNQDQSQAQTWYTAAADQGYEKAIDRLTQPLQPAASDARQTMLSRVWNLNLPEQFKQALPPATPIPERLGIKVQLGAMSTKDAAIDLWQLIRDELPQQSRALPITVSRFKGADQAEIFRLRVGDFSNVPQAKDFCDSVEKLSRRPCWVVADQAQW